jgi:hypothetical protein
MERISIRDRVPTIGPATFRCRFPGFTAGYSGPAEDPFLESLPGP